MSNSSSFHFKDLTYRSARLFTEFLSIFGAVLVEQMETNQELQQGEENQIRNHVQAQLALTLKLEFEMKRWVTVYPAQVTLVL